MSLFHIHSTQVGSSLKESRRVIGRSPHAGQRLDVLYPMPTTHDSLFFAGKNLVCVHPPVPKTPSFWVSMPPQLS